MRLLCLFFSISLTLSSKIIGSVSSALTIYKGGQGSINDVYKILYDTPKSTLYFTNVPSTIQKDSIQFNPNNAEVKVYGVSYNNGAKKEDKLANLKNNINKTISFKSADGKSYRGKLIGYGANFIKIINPLTGKIQQLSGSLQLPSQASQVKPPFIALTASAGYHITSSTNVNYQASGLRWAAFYTLFLNPDQTRANLSIQVNVENRSGKKFTNTDLSLSTQKYDPPAVYGSQDAFGELQPSANKYTVDRKVNITEGANKIQLFDTVHNINFNKILSATIESGTNPQEVKFTTQYTIANPSEVKLPGGTMRVLKKNPNGVTQKLGEYAIQPTAQWEDIIMRTGNPSDFKAQYIVRNKNKIMLQMANLASKPALIELKLKKRPNLQVSYDAGYKGTRWQKVKEDLYELGMMLPGNSTRSLYWNEVGIR